MDAGSVGVKGVNWAVASGTVTKVDALMGTAATPSTCWVYTLRFPIDDSGRVAHLTVTSHNVLKVADRYRMDRQVVVGDALTVAGRLRLPAYAVPVYVSALLRNETHTERQANAAALQTVRHALGFHVNRAVVSGRVDRVSVDETMKFEGSKTWGWVYELVLDDGACVDAVSMGKPIEMWPPAVVGNRGYTAVREGDMLTVGGRFMKSSGVPLVVVDDAKEWRTDDIAS